METSSTIVTLLSFGFAGIGCLAIVEKFVPLFPSYVLLMFLGMTISDGPTLAMTILVTTIGSVIGAVGWYGLGSALGCSSSDNLRPLRHFEKGGSGSSRVKV